MRDEELRKKRQHDAKKGGNPRLVNPGDNQRDNHSPNQKTPPSSSSSSSEEREDALATSWLEGRRESDKKGKSGGLGGWRNLQTLAEVVAAGIVLAHLSEEESYRPVGKRKEGQTNWSKTSGKA